MEETVTEASRRNVATGFCHGSAKKKVRFALGGQERASEAALEQRKAPDEPLFQSWPAIPHSVAMNEPAMEAVSRPQNEIGASGLLPKSAAACP